MNYAVKRVLLTGASGFVGRALLARLAKESSIAVRVAHRREQNDLPQNIEAVRIRELSSSTAWQASLSDIDLVVHAAGRAHVTPADSGGVLNAFRRVNTQGTLNLAHQAAERGVRRFIFVSSIKVNGEYTISGKPFTPDDLPTPIGPYAISKYEAENGLRLLAQQSGMDVVIIRPVLVYGPGVKANFLAMLRWLKSGVPLPFAAVDNRRSLVALDNLVDLISTCLSHPRAGNRTFMVSDKEDLSTPSLLRRTARAMGKSARLFPVPSPLIRASARLLGKEDLARSLCDSLQVDISKTIAILGWNPPTSVDDALRKTALHFAGVEDEATVRSIHGTT
jgi:nucleoside-diphosphate-sugar epimerase